ncbi:MAG: WD40/YVTN/BNR-like repeat-containing protein [Bacteroidota bacterium]
MKKYIATRLILIICSVAGYKQTSAQSTSPYPFQSFRFRYIGPDGNRTIAVAGEAGNPEVAYVGAASGGIFKTNDGGIHWQPIFDEMDNAAIGALAVSSSHPKHVWAGTGETFIIRPAHPNGNGVYKSTDAGKTWRHMGLSATVRISRVIIHPTDTNTVYVAALGSTHAPQAERGIFKTTDGGKNWSKVLFVDDLTGCSDLSINPQQPDELVAAMWQVSMTTAQLKSGGPGSGFYRTRDGGKTWQPLRNGLPWGKEHPVGKTSVDYAAGLPRVIYALVEDTVPTLYRSADGGDSWQRMQQNHSLAQRGPYYTRVRVSPQDENKLYTISVTIMESKDGGKTFNGNGTYEPGGDNHDIWFDPTDAKRIMVAHDGCLNMSMNGGKTWKNINLPIAQMYHVSTDNAIPYNIMGNRQDGYSYHTASISREGSIPLGNWKKVGGCESGFAQADPFDHNIIWSGCYDGGLDVTDLRTGLSHDVRVWPLTGYGWAPANVPYRWHWNFPMTLSRHQRGVVYVGSQFLHKTTNAGKSWSVISPDLTTNDKSRQQHSGGIANDNLMTFDGCTLYAIAESPVKQGVLWTGSNDGQIHVTRDEGKSWTLVSKNIPGLQPGGTISNIYASSFDAATAYVSIKFQFEGDYAPYVFKTTDFGKTWQSVVGNLPRGNNGFVHFIKEDPAQKGLLFAGTDNGLYVSGNDGKEWIQLKRNLPPAPVYHIDIQPQFSDLVVATYGRGIYVLDDITAIRAWSKSAQQPATSLFPLRAAYRFHRQNGIHVADNGMKMGENPTDEAVAQYFLSDTCSKAPELCLLNEKGDTIQSWKGSNVKGMNRVWFSMAHRDLSPPILKTQPRGKPFVQLNAEGNRYPYINDLDMAPGLAGLRLPPGKYRLVLKTDQAVFSQPITFLQDPHSKASREDILEQYRWGNRLIGSIKRTIQLIEAIEVQRARLLKENSAAARTREELLYQLEAKLIDVQQTGARWDSFRNPSQLLEHLLGLSKEALAMGADFAPTDQQRKVLQQLEQELNQYEKTYQPLK